MKLRIGSKLLLLVALLAIALLTMAVGSLWQLHSALLEGKKSKGNAVVETALSVVRRHHDAASHGEIPVEEAKLRALAELRSLRYDGDNYLWVNDFSSTLLMHPVQRDREGADLSTFQDKDGRFLFAEFTRIAQGGGGYVYYQWPRPGTDIQEPKVSYVAPFHPWGWVLGTGIYIGDVDTQFHTWARRFATFMGIVIIAALLAALAAARSITRPLADMTALTVRLSKGDTDVDIPNKGTDDEIGDLARALHVFREHIRTIANLHRIREEEQTLAAEELRASEERVRMLLESTGDGIYGIDKKGRCTILNPAAMRFLALESPDQIVGEAMHTLIHHHYEDGRPYPVHACPIQACLLSGKPAHIQDEVFFRPDGSFFPVDYRVHPMLQHGEVTGAVVIFTDITEERQIRNEMKIARTVFDTTEEGIVVTDSANRIQSVNPAFERITGYIATEVIGKTPAVLSSGKHDSEFYGALWSSLKDHGNWQGEIWNKRKNGDIYAEWVTITALRGCNGQGGGYVAIFSDITNRAHAAARVRREANFDPLTELPNRRYFNRKFADMIAVAATEGREMALLFIDLDRFKTVNDKLGHAIGDRLLVEVAARLKSCVRNSDLIARLGGDEFVIVLDGLATLQDGSAIAEKIVSAVAEPYIIDRHDIHVGTSIGLAFYPLHGKDDQTLIIKADAAMYQAKRAGRSRFVLAENEPSET